MVRFYVLMEVTPHAVRVFERLKLLRRDVIIVIRPSVVEFHG